MGDGLTVEVLTDKDKLLHTVTIDRIPVASDSGLTVQQGFKVSLGHGGIPQTRIAEGELTASLLEDVASVVLIAEVTHALGTDDATRPVTGHELIETTQVEGTATGIDHSANAILLCLALVVVMMMVVMVAVMMLVFIVIVIIVVMVVVMLVIIIVVIVIMVMVVLVIIIVIVVVMVVLVVMVVIVAMALFTVMVMVVLVVMTVAFHMFVERVVESAVFYRMVHPVLELMLVYVQYCAHEGEIYFFLGV